MPGRLIGTLTGVQGYRVQPTTRRGEQEETEEVTETVIRQIVRRAVSDAAFRGQLRTDPAKALAGISLTAEERSALTTGDPARLTALGVDQRMSKAFSSGLFSEASRTVIGDPDLMSSGTLTDEATAGERSGIAGDPAVAAAAAFESPAHTAADYQLKMTEGNIDTSAASADATYGSAADYQLQMTEGRIDGSAASADATYGSAADHQLLVTEGNIDTSSAFEPSFTSTSDHLLQVTEGNIDTGAVVDPSIDAPTDVQINEVHPSEF